MICEECGKQFHKVFELCPNCGWKRPPIVEGGQGRSGQSRIVEAEAAIGTSGRANPPCSNSSRDVSVDALGMPVTWPMTASLLAPSNVHTLGA